MTELLCEVSGCPDSAAGRIEVSLVADGQGPWFCGAHLVEEAEKVRDEPEFWTGDPS